MGGAGEGWGWTIGEQETMLGSDPEGSLEVTMMMILVVVAAVVAVVAGCGNGGTYDVLCSVTEEDLCCSLHSCLTSQSCRRIDSAAAAVVG